MHALEGMLTGHSPPLLLLLLLRGESGEVGGSYTFQE